MPPVVPPVLMDPRVRSSVNALPPTSASTVRVPGGR